MITIQKQGNITVQPFYKSIQQPIFGFLFNRTPIQVCHPPPPLLRHQRIHMEEIHRMAWGPQQKWYHPILQDGGFGIFYSVVTIHVSNLSQNRLTCVNGILSAPKSLTEFQHILNSFKGNSPPRFWRFIVSRIFIFCTIL